MTELSSEALALLEAARRSHGPTEHDRERVLGGLYASLGIAVPLALTASAAEAASAANLAATAQGAAAVQSAGQVVQSAGQAMLAQAGAASAAKGGAWSFGVKLLTWNAGKVFLATLALGSAVGVGVHNLPSRVVEDQGADVRSVRAVAKGRAAVTPGAVAAMERTDAPAAADGTTIVGTPTATRAAAPLASAEVVQLAERAGDNAAPVAAVAPAPTVEPVVTRQLVATPVESESASASTETAAPVARSSRYTASHRTSSAHTHRRRIRTSASDSVRAATLVAAAKPATSADSAAASTALAATTPPAPTAPVASAPIAGAAVAVEAVKTPVVATAQATGELALIRQALTSLRDRDASGALALLDEHAARYPSGAFATERRGLHVVALCAAGNLRDGRSEQAAFLRQAPSSPIAPRVRRACEEPKK